MITGVQKNDGMNYAPRGKPSPVVKEGEFKFAAIGLDHGHIYGQTNGLLEAGATLTRVWDPDQKKMEAFIKQYPQAKPARSENEILDDSSIQLIASAAIPCDRCALGLRVIESGKDYFTDKAPLISLEQLTLAREATARTGKKYMVYYSERLHVESAVHVGKLIDEGAIGRVLHVTGFGPHRLGLSSRPDWFFKKAQYGGILCDIGSHQIEQFLFYTGAKDASVVRSHVANHGHPETPELEDFGEALLAGDNGTSFYFQVDWFTPDGLGTWGDGRTFILGTEGTIEMRKYIDVARDRVGNHVYLTDKTGEHHLELEGKVGYPFFGELILDCLNRTENAMTQEHAFKAAELSILSQLHAERLVSRED